MTQRCPAPQRARTASNVCDNQNSHRIVVQRQSSHFIAPASDNRTGKSASAATTDSHPDCRATCALPDVRNQIVPTAAASGPHIPLAGKDVRFSDLRDDHGVEWPRPAHRAVEVGAPAGKMAPLFQFVGPPTMRIALDQDCMTAAQPCCNLPGGSAAGDGIQNRAAFRAVGPNNPLNHRFGKLAGMCGLLRSLALPPVTLSNTSNRLEISSSVLFHLSKVRLAAASREVSKSEKSR